MKLIKIIKGLCSLPIVASTILPLSCCKQDETTFTGGSLKLEGRQGLDGNDSNCWQLKRKDEIVEARYSIIYKSFPLDQSSLFLLGGYIFWRRNLEPGIYQFQIRALTENNIFLTPTITLTIHSDDDVLYFNEYNPDHYYLPQGEEHIIIDWYVQTGGHSTEATYKLIPIDCTDEIQSGLIKVIENENIYIDGQLPCGSYKFQIVASNNLGTIRHQLQVIIYKQTTDSDFTWDADTETTSPTITGYVGQDEYICLPAEHEKDGSTYPVRGLAQNAFTSELGKKVKCVVFPSTILVGDSCFQDCNQLKFLCFKSRVGTFGNKAFYNCSGLERVDCSVSEFNPESIGDECFKNCIHLSDLPTIKSQLIPKSCFENCKSLTKVFCHSQYIYEKAFAGCDNIYLFRIAEKLNFIGSLAFEKCLLLTFLIWNNPLSDWSAVIKEKDWAKNVNPGAIFAWETQDEQLPSAILEWDYLWKVI